MSKKFQPRNFKESYLQSYEAMIQELTDLMNNREELEGQREALNDEIENLKFALLGLSVVCGKDAGEALCKVLCHNICCVIQSMYELNLKPKFWAEVAA